MEIHRSALRHGIGEDSIRHAIDMALVFVDLDPEAVPPKVLVIGPDAAGNLVEVVWVVLEDDIALVIHAMRLRAQFYDLLPSMREEDE